MKKLIGTKKFYKQVLSISIPIMLQNGITNFVSLLDNIMVGRLGTEPMSGVSIVNQLIFIFYLCLFGAFGGAGILTAQYFGQKNNKGIQYTFRFKIMMGLIILLSFTFLFFYRGDNLIRLFLHEGSAEGDLIATLGFGHSYMIIMIWGLLFTVAEQLYSSTLRECGETMLPMIASIIAVFINLIFNYILIFGHFGAPAMGVNGAAIATVISKVIQAMIVIYWAHANAGRFTFIRGIYATLAVPVSVIGKILKMALPLVINETLWAAGVSALIQIYSYRGLSVVAAMNINNTINNVFNIAFIAFGDAVAIIVGQLLGAGKFDEARRTAYQIIAFSTTVTALTSIVLFLFAPVFPSIYNTSDEVRSIAAGFIRMLALTMPINAFLHSTYFTIRSGGKVILTFLFDSVFLWLVTIPVAYILVQYTLIGIILIFLIVESTNVIKSLIGWAIMRSGTWMQQLVNK